MNRPHVITRDPRYGGVCPACGKRLSAFSPEALQVRLTVHARNCGPLKSAARDSLQAADAR